VIESDRVNVETFLKPTGHVESKPTTYILHNLFLLASRSPCLRRPTNLDESNIVAT
jgi:hypothetical protein